MTAKPPQKKLARVPSRQRRSIRSEMTAQYKMSKKVVSEHFREFCLGKEYLTEGKRPHSTRWLPNLLRKNWREFRLGKEGLSEAKCPHSTKWVKKLLQKIGESPVHVCIGFVSCNGGTVLRSQKKCDKHEEMFPRERNGERCKKMNAKPAWQKWARVRSPHHMPR